MIQNKTKQQAEQENLNNILNQEANNTKRKSKNLKQKWKQEGRKK